MNFIEQFKHLLWNWDSWECILMKIIKGKWIFIMLFLTSVDSNMTDIFLGCVGLWAPYSDYCMVCFFCKVFKRSGTAVALRRSVSKVPCITLVFSSTFIMSISVIWCGSLHFHQMFVWDDAFLIITHQFQMRFLDKD